MLSIHFLATSLALACIVFGQDVPFSINGYLSSALASGTAFNSGGTVVINGYNIKIPSNMLVDLPAAQVPFAEFASGTVPPPNEVSINGNIVGGTIIAAQMFVAGLGTALGSGYIASLDFDGAIHIANGPILRINDPNAVYTAGYTKAPLFTADDENPSISSFGGFPMCVPRNASDPQCPQSNRPTNVANPKNYFVPDPSHMAPLKVGDFVEFSGVEYDGVYLVYALTANVGIYTRPGVAPSFIKVEDCLIGLQGNNPDLEYGQSRWVGYVTDPSINVNIYAIDIDPCTGAETDRFLGTTAPERLVGGRAKWELRVRALPPPYSRNYRITTSSGTVKTSDGILAGQYVQPVTEYIFPEVVTPGALNAPMEFQLLAALANGFGPDDDGNVFHQLSPWPGSSPPTPSKNCPDVIPKPVTTSSTAATASPTETGATTRTGDDTTSTPTATPTPSAVNITASAGKNQSVLGGTVVTLNGTQTEPNVAAADLTYVWSQVSGNKTGVALSATNVPGPTFELPFPVSATVNETRIFNLQLTHKTGTTSSSNVTIIGDTVSSSGIVFDTFSWASRQSGTVVVTAHSNLVNVNAIMKVRFTAIPGTADATMTKIGRGQWTYSARSIPSPVTAYVQEYVGTIKAGTGGSKSPPTAG